MRTNYLIWWCLTGLVRHSLTRAVIDSSSRSHADRCPDRCGRFASDPSSWTSVPRLQDLDDCNEPILFDLNGQNAAVDPNAQNIIQACVQSPIQDETRESLALTPRDTSAGAPISPASSCGAFPRQIPIVAHVGSRTADPAAAKDVFAAARQLADYVQNQPLCDPTVLFAKVGDSVLGLYSGAEIHKSSTADLIRTFQDYAHHGAEMFQVCDDGGPSDARTFGLYAGSMADMQTIQDAITTWKHSKCLDFPVSFRVNGLNMGLLTSNPAFFHPRMEEHMAKVAIRDTADAAACSPNDATYSNEDMPGGSYMPGSLSNLGDLTSGVQYITIVNLTPHRFVLSSTHSYQMDEFDWGDIPPGRARQNTAHYTEAAGKNAVDDNGEAYYTIEGTSKQFVIRATTHIPDDHPRRTVVDLTGMGMGQREYLDPSPEVPVTLVITGSDSYGFISSITYGQGNWMRNIYDVIKDRSIQHIVLPGTHDAGMSTISGKIVSLGTSANTQTQALSVYNQLRAGSRWFDLRVMSVHQILSESNYSFWVAHVNDETADVAVGNTGESLDNVISEINEFIAESPGEIVFFRIRYLIGIREFPSGGPIYWGNDIVANFFNQLKKVNNRCGNLDTTIQFQHQDASYFMDRNNGSGCVIFLLVGDNLKTGVTRESVSDGLYAAEKMPIDDNWSNLPNTQPMAEDQIADWSSIQRSSPFSNDQFLVSQWLVSADAVTTTALTIENIAILPTNPSLYWAGVNGMSPTKWPNVLLLDYLGVVVANQFAWEQLSAELYTLAIGLNLYMISENCDVSHQRSPLLPPVTSTRKVRNNAFPTWNGIIFANGTVIDHPPHNLHLGRVEILKKGTVFDNGTVLTQDIQNPNYRSMRF